MARQEYANDKVAVGGERRGEREKKAILKSAGKPGSFQLDGTYYADFGEGRRTFQQERCEAWSLLCRSPGKEEGHGNSSALLPVLPDKEGQSFSRSLNERYHPVPYWALANPGSYWNLYYLYTLLRSYLPR